MSPREWADDTRGEALELLASAGAEEASLATGVPVGTIRRWAAEAGLVAGRQAEPVTFDAEAAIARRAAVERRPWSEVRADMLGSVAVELQLQQQHLEQFGDRGDTKRAKDAAVMVGILIDKAELLAKAEGADADAPTRAEVDKLLATLAWRRLAALDADALARWAESCEGAARWLRSEEQARRDAVARVLSDEALRAIGVGTEDAHLASIVARDRELTNPRPSTPTERPALDDDDQDDGGDDDLPDAAELERTVTDAADAEPAPPRRRSGRYADTAVVNDGDALDDFRMRPPDDPFSTWASGR